jgi:hypothetical protein
MPGGDDAPAGGRGTLSVMVRAEGQGRTARLSALGLLAFAACIPGALTLEAGDASTGSDGSPVSAEGGADGGSSSGGDATGGGDSTSTEGGSSDGGSGGDVVIPSETGPGETGPADTGSPPGCDCLPPPPSAWGFVAMYIMARNSCPAGYANYSDVIINPSDLGPSTCGCDCTQTTPSCTSGDFALAYGSMQTACTTSAGTFPASDGACVPGSFPFAATDHMVDAAPPVGGSCTPSPTVTPPSPGGYQGKACGITASLGTGCGGNQVCAPAVSDPWIVCIEQAGAQTCPSGYPTSYATGTGITPGGCTACTCGTQVSCDNPTLSVYADDACQTLQVSVAADGVCTDTPGGYAGASYLYTATGSVACSPSTPTPTGSSSLSGLMTVCCPP